jgi:hypothetical protein
MLTPPAFKKDAVPSIRGWHDPRTGELLVSRPMKQADVDEYNGVKAETVGPATVIHPVEPVVEEVEEEIQFLTEADPTEAELDLEILTSSELKAMCDDHGISYRWGTKKSTLIERLKEVL